MLNLNWIISAIIAVLLFAGGYALGARKVASLEAQLEELKRVGDSAEATRKNAQAEIDKALKAQGAEHAKQVEAMKADAERRSKELNAALAGARDRNAELEKRASANTAQIAKLRGDLAASSPAGRADLQARIDALESENRTLAGQSGANQCLAMAIPAPVIRPLIK